MDDMFDMGDLYAGDEDSMLSEFDAGQEQPMRSRAYTWPTRPVVAPVADEASSAGSEASPGVMPVAGPRLLSADEERGSRGELQLSPGGGVSASRKASSRRNAWGNLSYADLITKAIESSPEKRLTLSQIYAWMVSNVPFFSDKGDSNSSAGWKNSIRHNLSLHSRFIRVQNEGTGKSSWWMVNPDAVSKVPRKRAGTMDSTTVRRPTRASKRPSGSLKHARSSEFHASGNELFDPNAARGSPSMIGNELPGFDSPRVRASSGNSSTGGCSPAALGTPLESDIKPCFAVPPSTWDMLYAPKQETLSESLADIFISDAAGGSPICGRNSSPSSQMYSSHQGLQQQQQPMFMTNEAYAHGVPVHQPSTQRFVPQSFSPPIAGNVVGAGGYPVTVTSPGVGYQTNGGQVYGCNGGGTTERVPTLGELLQDQQSRSGYMLNTFLTSGGSVTSQQQGWSGDEPSGVTTPQQPPAGAAGTPPRRPLHIDPRRLMQLLATKPHLARRLQQLLEAKRRQLGALQQQAPPSPQSVLQPSPSSVPVTTHSPAHSTAMLQQLLTTAGPRPHPLGIGVGARLPVLDPNDDAFPKDLDLNLLDLQSTSDINCDIEQVISHELSFGDKLDFSFDQLHLGEFDTDFGS